MRHGRGYRPDHASVTDGSDIGLTSSSRSSSRTFEDTYGQVDWLQIHLGFDAHIRVSHFGATVAKKIQRKKTKKNLKQQKYNNNFLYSWCWFLTTVTVVLPVGCVVMSCDIASFCVTTESTNQNTAILHFIQNKQEKKRSCHG